MPVTPSTMIPLGTRAPDFRLKDVVSGGVKTLDDLKSSKGTVVLFICNHCPFVVHINPVLVKVATEYQQKGLSFVAINSNDIVEYPDDSPQHMQARAKEMGYPFPYLFDETQEVAKAYDAACTPDIFVFDKDLKCVYRGQFDDSRPGNQIPVTGKDLSEALEKVLKGEPLDPHQKPSIGCNIKWKSD